MWEGSYQWLLRNYTFYIWVHLLLKVVFIWKFVKFGMVTLLQVLILGKMRPVVAEIFSFLFLRSSSIRCFLHEKHLLCLVWSLKLKFSIWEWSDQWLLRYPTFNICGHLPLQVVFIWIIFKVWFGHLCVSLKFGNVQTSGCWDIPLLTFEVDFH